MGITDELRAYAGNFYLFRYKDVREKLDAIADRIDAEYERVRAESIIDMTDKSMAENGWVRLPVDADGEYIHIGDVMEWCDSGETLTVEGIGRDMLFYIDGVNAVWTAARNKRHHHEPTVEDVLLEACNAYHSLLIEGMSDVAHDMPAPSEIIAEYSAKLRLANDGEEQ